MSIIDLAAAERIAKWVDGRRDEMVEFLANLARVESPTDAPETQAAVQTLLAGEFEALGMQVQHLEGTRTGGHLLAQVAGASGPSQLLVGHTDTVWPVGTIDDLPVEESDGVIKGPGVFDMKGGLTQVVFALRALVELDLAPAYSPVVFFNSDEEIGSPESRPHVKRLAQSAERAFILEPAMGPSGHIKTARKGVGKFTITITGRSAHAGLEPEAGASAIIELSHVIQALHALNDRERGVTVNVGVIDGGVRPNVVAPISSALVDVRVPTMADARVIEEVIHGLEPTTEGVTLSIEGSVGSPPLERTPRNQELWRAAQAVGAAMGLTLEDAMAGGGSDGNTTSQFTATLDGLGPIGDGAHARHEHVRIDGMVERCGLLAGLLVSRPFPAGPREE